MKTTTIPTLRAMFEAGVHFGHKKQNSDARARDSFFAVQNRVVIINLEKTRDALTRAAAFVARQAQEGAIFLFVGTKNRIEDVVRKAAEETGMPYVTNRWLGGTLTNFDTVKNSLKKLADLEVGLNEKHTKKEGIMLQREITRIRYNLSGITDVNRLPQVLIVVDAHEEKNAVAEAKKLGIPIVAILDTNADPRPVDFPIPANDDTSKSVSLLLDILVSAIKDNYKAPVAKEGTEAKEKMSKKLEAGSAKSAPAKKPVATRK